MASKFSQSNTYPCPYHLGCLLTDGGTHIQSGSGNYPASKSSEPELVPIKCPPWCPRHGFDCPEHDKPTAALSPQPQLSQAEPAAAIPALPESDKEYRPTVGWAYKDKYLAKALDLALQVWIAQGGRAEEQRYGAVNFLTGNGAITLQSYITEQKIAELEELKNNLQNQLVNNNFMARSIPTDRVSLTGENRGIALCLHAIEGVVKTLKQGYDQ